jgi:hypothetical protein
VSVIVAFYPELEEAHEVTLIPLGCTTEHVNDALLNIDG